MTKTTETEAAPVKACPPAKRSILVVGKRWHHKLYGNTYFVCHIHVDGEHVATLPFQYGYGDQWEYAAAQFIRENGIFPLGKDEPLWTIRDKGKPLGIDLYRVCVDVQRKGDM